MEEKSAFDILIENLIDLGFTPESNASYKPFTQPGSDRFLNTKYVYCTLSDSIYFYASDSFGASNSSTFTGLYSSIQLPKEAEYKVVNKIWFDFLHPKKKKSGVKYVDENVTILSSNWIPDKELSKENIELFLHINKTGKPYSLIVENNYLPRCEILKGKKIIGIETTSWIYKKDELKKFIALGKALITNIKNVATMKF